LASGAASDAELEPEEDARVLSLRNSTAYVTLLEQWTPTISGIFLQLGAYQAIDFPAGQYMQV